MKKIVIGIVCILIICAGVYILMIPSIKITCGSEIDVSIKGKVSDVHSLVLQSIIEERPQMLEKCLADTYVLSGGSAQSTIEYIKPYFNNLPFTIEEFYVNVNKPGTVTLTPSRTGYRFSATFNHTSYIILSEIQGDNYDYILKTNYSYEPTGWKLEGCQIAVWKMHHLSIAELINAATQAEAEGDILTAYLYTLFTQCIQSPFPFYTYGDYITQNQICERIQSEFEAVLPIEVTVANKNIKLESAALEVQKNHPIFSIYYSADNGDALSSTEVEDFFSQLQGQFNNLTDYIEDFKMQQVAN